MELWPTASPAEAPRGLELIPTAGRDPPAGHPPTPTAARARRIPPSASPAGAARTGLRPHLISILPSSPPPDRSAVAGETWQQGPPPHCRWLPWRTFRAGFDRHGCARGPRGQALVLRLPSKLLLASPGDRVRERVHHVLVTSSWGWRNRRACSKHIWVSWVERKRLEQGTLPPNRWPLDADTVYRSPPWAVP
jgi:hypothetical protein